MMLVALRRGRSPRELLLSPRELLLSPLSAVAAFGGLATPLLLDLLFSAPFTSLGWSLLGLPIVILLVLLLSLPVLLLLALRELSGLLVGLEVDSVIGVDVTGLGVEIAAGVGVIGEFGLLKILLAVQAIAPTAPTPNKAIQL